MTSPVDTSVKFVWSGYANQPAGPNGNIGGLIPLLDAFLVNGWGTSAVTGASITGGICTLTVAAACPAFRNGVILVSGFTGAYVGLNGEQKVTANSSTSASFATALTGTPTSSSPSFMMAPAGYTKIFSGTNLAAYQSNDVTSTQHVIRIDDTFVQASKVVMYESMSDISTGVNPYPTAVQVSGGLYTWRSSATNATGNPYFFASNGKKLMLGIAEYRQTTANTPYAVQFFGDITSYKAADAFRSMILASTSAAPSSNISPTMGTLAAGATVGLYMARLHTGLGTSQGAGLSYPGFGSCFSGGSLNTYGPYPSPVDGALLLTSPQVSVQLGTYGFRGYISGFYGSPQVFPGGSFADGDLIDGTGDTAGKKLFALWTGSSAYSDVSYNGMSFIDVTGPWAS